MGKQNSHLPDLQIDDYVICDLGRIQTCNLLSRNQVHYSVMLRGRNKVQI